jgi:hypothetical protein
MTKVTQKADALAKKPKKFFGTINEDKVLAPSIMKELKRLYQLGADTPATVHKIISESGIYLPVVKPEWGAEERSNYFTYLGDLLTVVQTVFKYDWSKGMPLLEADDSVLLNNMFSNYGRYKGHDNMDLFDSSVSLAALIAGYHAPVIRGQYIFTDTLTRYLALRDCILDVACEFKEVNAEKREHDLKNLTLWRMDEHDMGQGYKDIPPIPFGAMVPVKYLDDWSGLRQAELGRPYLFSYSTKGYDGHFKTLGILEKISANDIDKSGSEKVRIAYSDNTYREMGIYRVNAFHEVDLAGLK